MAANFDKYLDVAVESIERPSAPPIGHWGATIAAWKGKEKNFGETRKNVPMVEVTFKLTHPEEDAIESAEAAGIDANSFVNRTVTRDYDLSDDIGNFGLRQLGETACGLDVAKLSLRDMLAQLKDQPVKLYMEQRPGQDEGQFYPKVAKVLAP